MKFKIFRVSMKITVPNNLNIKVKFNRFLLLYILQVPINISCTQEKREWCRLQMVEIKAKN
jgi:hypothetical protein